MVIDHPRRKSKSTELPPFYLDDHTSINQVHKIKYLVLTVDNKLYWNEQYKSVKGKVVGGLASIRKLKISYHNPSNSMYIKHFLKAFSNGVSGRVAHTVFVR